MVTCLVKVSEISDTNISLDITLEIDANSDVRIGDNMSVTIKVVNTSREDLNVNLVVGGQIVRYDGVSKVRLEKHQEKIIVRGDRGQCQVRNTLVSTMYVSI